MSWIESISLDRAEPKLRKIYERSANADGTVDNVITVHGLRPHSLEGHLALYRSVLHHKSNALDYWLLETIGVYVSQLNDCDYCVSHHQRGLGKIVGRTRAHEIRTALSEHNLERVLDQRNCTALRYARQLTEHPANVTEATITTLRQAGFSDGEILEINQVVAYFAYANRTVLGLGVELELNNT